jgi:UDP-glucose 4-epimerase
MKILVVGSNGFIGSHCVELLRINGYDVFEADIVRVNKDNFYQLDKVNPDFNNIFSKNLFDICINASGAASVPKSLIEPFNDFSLNTLNVIRLLESIRIFSPNCFFINFSSAAIYGNPINLPIVENMQPLPLSPYGFHKLYAEQVCSEYFDFFKIKSCNLRVFSAFGPRLEKQFFWDLYNKLKISDSVELFGTGKESRDFIFIDDLVNCILLIIKNRFILPNVINIASGIETKISDAAYLFANLLGTEKKITFNGVIREGEPLNWRADISTMKTIGFVPLNSIEKGIEKYIKWLISEKK